MNEIRLYLILRAPGGEWEITTHRGLQTAKARWKSAIDRDPATVAIAHVGLSRPSTRDLSAVMEAHPGRVLLTASTRWSAWGIEASSQSPVGHLGAEAIDEELPVYLALEGWGYRVSNEELAAIAPKTRVTFQDWLVELETDEPDLASQLLDGGAHSEPTYVKCRSVLPPKLRDVVDRYRFKRLAKQIDPKDPIQVLRIAPYWLLIRPKEEVELSARIGNAFERQGIRVFGDLLRFDRAEMLEWKNFGRKSIAELADSLFVAAGKLPPDAQKAEEMREEGSTLRECLENSLNVLPTQSAFILRGRLGADGEVRKLAEIARDLDLSRQRVQQLEHQYISRIIASYYWDDLLTEKIDDRISGSDAPVYVDLLGAEDPWFRGFEGREVYLGQVIQTFTEGDYFSFDLDGRRIVTRIRISAWNNIVREARSYLTEDHSPPLTRRQVALALESIASQGGAAELSRYLFEHLQAQMHFARESEREEDVLVGFGRSVEHAVRAVLTEATQPMHYSEVAERVRSRVGEDVEERRVHGALGAIGANLFARGTYGFRQHVGIPEEVCASLAEDVESMILEGDDQRQWHCHEICDLMTAERPELEDVLDPYRLNVILERAVGIENKGRFVWGKRQLSSRASKRPRVKIREACLEILRANGGPMTRDEIDGALAAVRGVGKHHQIFPGGELGRLAPKVWGLVSRDFRMTASQRAALLNRLETMLTQTGKGLHESEVAPLLKAANVDLDDGVTPSLILGVAEADERFRVSRGRVLRLSSWDTDEPMTVRQAIERIMTETPSIGSVSLKRRTEALLHRTVAIEELGEELASFGATLDQDGYTWLAPHAEEKRVDSPVESGSHA